MTRQKSDGRVVPEGRRKAVLTGGKPRGGKATTVKQHHQQLGLPFGTAERAQAPDDEVDRSVLRPATPAEPKPIGKDKKAGEATMEEIVKRLGLAFDAVARNKGAPGPDRQSINEVRKYLRSVLAKLGRSLLDGTYRPGDIRRVWIPKAGGGERGLGIPNVVDRVVQEAIRQAIEPLYEPGFHEESHGFRPGRSCHTAIQAAKKHLEEGYEWVVDLDLEKFFDRVNHQRLMARLANRIGDRRLLVVIGMLLKAKVVMPDGVVVTVEEGVPQGGPLSPLLSNIVLDELDAELRQRGHRFVRYADDCNIYVRTERSGQRVMESVTRFIESRLRLKVNVKKSAVARPGERHFLGFSLRRQPETGEVEVGLSKRTQKRISQRMRELTPRNWGSSLEECVDVLNRYLLGWIGFFGICSKPNDMRRYDAHIRRRLRAIRLKHWKRRLTMFRETLRLGVRPRTAARSIFDGRRSWWWLSHSPAVDRGLSVAYFAKLGLVSLANRWLEHAARAVVPRGQLRLALG